MIRVLLDTDHVSLHERGHLPLRARLASFPPEEVAVSVVTVEEMLRGTLGDSGTTLLKARHGSTPIRSCWKQCCSLVPSPWSPLTVRYRAAISGVAGDAAARGQSRSPHCSHGAGAERGADYPESAGLRAGAKTAAGRLVPVVVDTPRLEGQSCDEPSPPPSC